MIEVLVVVSVVKPAPSRHLLDDIGHSSFFIARLLVDLILHVWLKMSEIELAVGGLRLAPLAHHLAVHNGQPGVGIRRAGLPLQLG